MIPATTPHPAVTGENPPQVGKQTRAPLGLGFTPFEDRVEVIERAALLAEQHGFDLVGVAEAMTLDAPIVLTRLAGLTHRIALATGVLSVWGRTPATLALTASQMQRASGGRFVLGLGAGTAPITQGFHGQRWQAPVTKLRETLVAVRALLTGGRLPDVPEGARALRLGCPPSSSVPIALAAITPRSIQLAGTLADQWMPFLLPPAALDAGRVLMASAAADTGRGRAATVIASVPLALAATRDAANRIAATWLLTYATRMGPVYPRMLRAHGYDRELEALLEANRGSQAAILPVGAERLAHDVLLYGTYDDAPRLREAWLNHADALIAVAPFGVAAEDIADALEAIGAGRDLAGNDSGSAAEPSDALPAAVRTAAESKAAQIDAHVDVAVMPTPPPPDLRNARRGLSTC